MTYARRRIQRTERRNTGPKNMEAEVWKEKPIKMNKRCLMAMEIINKGKNR